MIKVDKILFGTVTQSTQPQLQLNCLDFCMCSRPLRLQCHLSLLSWQRPTRHRLLQLPHSHRPTGTTQPLQKTWGGDRRSSRRRQPSCRGERRKCSEISSFKVHRIDDLLTRFSSFSPEAQGEWCGHWIWFDFTSYHLHFLVKHMKGVSALMSQARSCVFVRLWSCQEEMCRFQNGFDWSTMKHHNQLRLKSNSEHLLPARFRTKS